MKRMMACFAALAMMCLCACALAATPTLNIAQLREQTPNIWEGEYVTRSGKTVSFRAPILMPTSDTFPVARMTRNYSNDEALAPYCADVPDKATMSLVIRRLGLVEAQEGRAKSAGHITSTGAELTTYHRLFMGETDIDAVYAEGQSISLGDVGRRLREMVKELFGDAYDIVLDQGGVNEPMQELKLSQKRGAEHYEVVGPLDMGEMTGAGSYNMSAIVTLNGIPQLGGPKFPTGYSTRTAENLLGWSYDNAELIRYLSDDTFVFYGSAFAIDEIVEEDVPLCTFDEVKAVLEGMIERDELGTVYALYLGWVCWLDPSVDYPTRDRDWAQGLGMPFLATPVWVAECSVTKSPTGKDYSEYPESGPDGEAYDYRKHDWGHTNLMINAQTCELYDQWDESKTRKIAPKVIGW